MNLRCIIIDDEETGIEALRVLIEKYIDDLKIVAQSTHASKAIELIESYLPDIVFLDISMPEMDGFELLEKLVWKGFELVFTTAHQEYGLKALKLNAADYLLKPVDHRELRIAVDKIKTRLTSMSTRVIGRGYTLLNNIQQHHTGKLAVNSKEGIEFIDPLQIISLESRSNYTKIHLNESESILSPKTLRTFDDQLCGSLLDFMRVHHSFIINLHRILRFEKENEFIVMTNGQRIPLSRSRKEGFVRWLKIS